MALSRPISVLETFMTHSLTSMNALRQWNCTKQLSKAHELCIYPSVTFREAYATQYPAVYTSVVAMAFLVTSILLFVYDRYVLVPLIVVSFHSLSLSLRTSPLFPVKAGGSATRQNNGVCSSNQPIRRDVIPR
jgi:hypothetical protein